MGPLIELLLLPYAFPALRHLEDYPVRLTVLEDYLAVCLCLHVFLHINVKFSGSRLCSNSLHAVQTYSQYYVLMRILLLHITMYYYERNIY